MSDEKRAIYLGDGVYATYDCGEIMLTMENTSDVIFLGRSEWEKLVAFRQSQSNSGTSSK